MSFNQMSDDLQRQLAGQNTVRHDPLTTEQMEQALEAFIGARDYPTTRAVLEEQRAILLHLETIRLLTHRLEYAESQSRRHLLRLHLEVLLLARERGISVAWEWLQHQLEQDIIQDLVEAMNPAEKQRFAHLTEIVANAQLTEAQRNEATREIQTLLAGVAQRHEPRRGQGSRQEPTHDQQILIDFVNAPTWAARFAMMQRNGTVLLRSAAIMALEQLATDLRRQDEQAANTVAECARVLRDAKERGIDAAQKALELRQGAEDGTMVGAAPSPSSSAPPPPIVLPSQSPSSPDAAPLVDMPAVTPEQQQRLRQMIAQPGALDDTTQRIVRAWLGESEEDFPLADIAATLRRLLAHP